ncbi:MAG: hypothetical protein P4L87_17865 [Formivibrio sp.]|nr:hypothetical protein [Formivibrio sp.]
MQPNRRISDVLPLSFSSGGQVRQFSKPCLHCGSMLTAKHMVGAACVMNNQIAIAARAQCPSCGESFSVTCLIDDKKRVRRVVVPYWLFNPYLRMLRPQGQVLAQREVSPDDELPVPSTLTVEEPVPVPVIPLDIERAEDTVGRYQNKPIPAWVRVNGKLFSFDHVAINTRTQDGEFLLDGCLVYRGQ